MKPKQRRTGALRRANELRIGRMDHQRGASRSDETGCSPKVVEMAVRQHDRCYFSATDGGHYSFEIVTGVDDDSRAIPIRHHPAVRLKRAHLNPRDAHLALALLLRLGFAGEHAARFEDTLDPAHVTQQSVQTPHLADLEEEPHVDKAVSVSGGRR